MNPWLGGFVAQRDLGSFNMAPTLRSFTGFDISLRFHHSTGFPVAALHNTCKKWWPRECLQGSQMCWDSNLFWFIPDTVHQTNGWRRISMHKHGVLLVFWCWSGQRQTWICPCFFLAQHISWKLDAIKWSQNCWIVSHLEEDQVSSQRDWWGCPAWSQKSGFQSLVVFNLSSLLSVNLCSACCPVLTHLERTCQLWPNFSRQMTIWRPIAICGWKPFCKYM